MAKTETYPECFLGSVVNPGEYWLVSRLKTHVKDVRKLEEMLAEEMNQILTAPDPAFLVSQRCVAVENVSVRGNWHRGKLIGRMEENVYRVFLVDCGHFTNVGIQHLQLITDQKYLEVEPLAFKLQLYGIVPFVVADNFKKKVSNIWSTSAKEFISNLFSQRLIICVKKVLIINRTVFGDLYLIDTPNCPSFSLGTLLCKRQFGVYAESYFKRKVMEIYLRTTSNNISEKSYLDLSPDVTMKLERVKEWQLSTIRHEDEKRREEYGSRILKTPSHGISDSENASHTFDGEKSEQPIAPADPRRESLNEKVHAEELCNNSRVNCNNSVGAPTLNPGAKGSDSFTTTILDKPYRCSLGENKKDFNIILEENFIKYSSNKNDFNTRIFARFSDSVVQPVNKLRNLNISQSIVLNLEKEGDFNDLSAIQRWGIPSIQRGHNVVMIGGPKTGKTLAYLIPFLAILQERMDGKEVSEGNGPLAVILCSGSRSCDIIYYICHLLLRNKSEKEKDRALVRVEVVYGRSREKKSWVQLTNGCELLISTPHCLARLLKHRGITNLERLEYLVLDEVDVIIQEPFLTPVKMILHQSKLSKDCQRVFCGEKWTPELGNLINTFSKSYAILIGSYLEAAIYAKLKPNFLLVDKEKKYQAVLDATLSQIGRSKILIACEHTSEVLILGDAYKANGYSPLLAHSDMVIHDMKVLERRWNFGTDAPIMICSDDVIHLLAIDDAEILVHYSLPYESKTNFGARFSVLMKSFRECSTRGDNPKEPSVLVLIDDENHYQLPHIVDFTLRLGGKIPEKIRALSHEISWRIEANKKDIPICRNLLEFGECKVVRNCNKRHAFIKDIDSSEILESGLVKFEVLHVHSVCYLSVRIIEVIDKTGKKTVFENLSGEISDKLRLFYEFEENRAFVGAIEINKLCSVEREDAQGKRFERAKIVELKKWNKLNKVTEVLVKFVDNGQLSRVSVYKLYELSEDLKKYDPQASDIFLCDLLPDDFDRTWNEEAIFSAKTLFMKPLKKNQFWFGRIRLALKNSLHLECVKLCRFLENVKTHVIDFSARRKLLTQGIAVENEKHFEKLRLLCQKANIEIPYYEGETNKLKSDIVEPQWAFLDGDLPKVEFVSADSGSCLYLRMAKFKNLLMELEKECQKVGEEMTVSRDAKKRTDKWTPHAGIYCLALYENLWNRGKILSVVGDKVLVFFIDYGDSHYVDALVPIPDALITQLPAQAIECCLVGIEHDSADSDAVLEEMYSFSNGGADVLYASIIDKSEASVMTGGWKYKVNLVNARGVSLSRKLVMADLIKAEESSFHLAVNVDIALSYSEDEKDTAETSGDEKIDHTEESSVVQKNHTEENELKLVSGEDLPCSVNISDEMFDDENAQLMIKEFMTHVFPLSVIKREGADDEGVEVSSGKGSGTTMKEPRASTRQNGNLTSDGTHKRGEKRERLSYTPQLSWCQDYYQIQIKIILNNVERYRLDCSTTHFFFRCLLDGKLYVAGLRLYGSVNPHLTEVRVKPFYVQVSLKKVCPLQWPRLPRDKHRHRWIRFDVEDFACEQDSYVEGICSRALAEIESGEVKQPAVERGEVGLVPSTDSDDDSESDNDAEDA